MSGCTCEQISGGGRRVDPACPAHRPIEERIAEVLGPLVEEVRARSFVPEYAAEQSTARIVGVIVSKFLHFDGDQIIEAAVEALTDSNFHDEAAYVQAVPVTV